MSNPIKLVEVWSLYTSKDKIITRIGNPYKNKDVDLQSDIALAVLVVVTEDFNLMDSDTYSYQIRPKALYKSSRGIFYKDGSIRRYLSTQEIIDLKIENRKLGKYLELKSLNGKEILC